MDFFFLETCFFSQQQDFENFFSVDPLMDYVRALVIDSIYLDHKF